MSGAVVHERTSEEVFVARQPILDADEHLYAYELLYRSSRENAFDGSDSSQATSRVISNSLLTIGIDRLVRGHRAFINFDRNMLVNGYAALLPSKAVVVEILEDVEPDEEVVAAVGQLKQQGYLLALDDFVGTDGYDRLIDLADIIKVDFRLTSPGQQARFARRYGARGIRMLAEKVETRDEFHQARQMGYQLFQGYFFSRPSIVAGKQVPGFKLNYLRVLKEISSPQLDYRKVEGIVKYEASLVHKLLRYVNSARFGSNREIGSIRHALALLGETEIRKWISLVALTGLAGDKPRQLVVTAVIRGRFCELIAPRIGLGRRQQEMFLMGMFSLLDAVLDRPMEEIVAEVHLESDLRDTLLEKPSAPSRLRGALAIVQAVEAADWPAVERDAEASGTTLADVSEFYLDSVDWADAIFDT